MYQQLACILSLTSLIVPEAGIVHVPSDTCVCAFCLSRSLGVLSSNMPHASPHTFPRVQECGSTKWPSHSILLNRGDEVYDTVRRTATATKSVDDLEV